MRKPARRSTPVRHSPTSNPSKKIIVNAKNDTQQKYLDSLSSNSITFGLGPAGTGKTFLAVARAVQALQEGKVKRLILTRPAVEAGEKLGFLPGDMAEKVNPYLRPLFDALHDLLDVTQVNALLERHIIEIAPLAFMRGRTLSDAFVILDEAQNTTIPQMKMLLTRMGNGSKIAVTGDESQVDLTAESGLAHAVGLLHRINGIGVVRFSDTDVVRHPLVAQIVRAYEGKRK